MNSAGNTSKKETVNAVDTDGQKAHTNVSTKEPDMIGVNATMEKKLNIYQRLNQVMKQVKAIQKEDKKVNNQYTFVSHDAVAAALHDPMVEAGIMMVPTIAELTQDGNRTAAKVQVDFVNIDDSADRVTVTYWGYGVDPSDKGIGKAVSYAVKYALLKVFCLETGDDVEKHNLEYKPPVPPAPKAVDMSVVFDRYPNERDKMTQFITNYSTHYGMTVPDCVSKLTETPGKLENLFEKWKAKQEAAQ